MMKPNGTRLERGTFSRRRALLLIPFAAAVVAPVSLFARSRFEQPAAAVDSIRATSQYQDAVLLGRAWTLPAAQRMQPGFRFQRNSSSCGPASLANVFRSLGQAVDEAAVVAGTGKCWTSVCFGGVTLDELSGIATANPAHRVKVLRDLSFEQFMDHLRHSNDPQRRYIVNFDRGPLFGQGHGHHSPIGGYLERENLAFILDTNESYKPFLVDPRRLFEAVNTVDCTGGKKRGLLLIE
jgi:phytochelatin synthase